MPIARTTAARQKLVSYDKTPPRAIGRRPSRAQGRTLEVIGHAIEYLVDSRLQEHHLDTMQGDTEAVRLLSSASSTVFLECSEIVPLDARMREWTREHLQAIVADHSLHIAHNAKMDSRSRGFRFHSQKMKTIFRTVAFCMLTLDVIAFALEDSTTNLVSISLTQESRFTR